jgi:hypothetical protein
MRRSSMVVEKNVGAFVWLANSGLTPSASRRAARTQEVRGSTPLSSTRAAEFSTRIDLTVALGPTTAVGVTGVARPL